MTFRLCSIHDRPLVPRLLGGVHVLTCPVADCIYRRSAKFAPVLMKSRPAAMFKSVGDRMPRQRDKVTATRTSPTSKRAKGA